MSNCANKDTLATMTGTSQRCAAGSGQGNPAGLSFASFVCFILLVAITGLGVGVLLSAPLFILGRVWTKFYAIGAYLLQNTIRWLIVAPIFRTKSTLNFSIPCLTMSNHRSTLDTFILLSHIPGLRLIAKESLFKVPCLSFVMKAMGQIKVKKQDMDSYFKAMEQAGIALKQGASVHIFPEMTRCSEGFVGTQRFHLAPFRMAMELKTKIIPLVFFNTDKAWPRGFFKMNRKVVVKVKALDAVLATDFADSASLLQEVERRINMALKSENEAEA